jgi:hypothetical protein
VTTAAAATATATAYLDSGDETLGRFEGRLRASRTLAHTIGRLGDPAEVFAALPFMVGL